MVSYLYDDEGHFSEYFLEMLGVLREMGVVTCLGGTLDERVCRGVDGNEVLGLPFTVSVRSSPCRIGNLSYSLYSPLMADVAVLVVPGSTVKLDPETDDLRTWDIPGYITTEDFWKTAKMVENIPGLKSVTVHRRRLRPIQELVEKVKDLVG